MVGKVVEGEGIVKVGELESAGRRRERMER
jgi:hypothetical protein